MNDSRIVGAVFDPTGTYRYRLDRWLGPRGGRLCWIMLNPSEANAVFDDATIRRCCGFAERGRFGAIRVVNLFAYRTPHTAKLVAAHKRGIHIVGHGNDAYILDATQNSIATVVAWGAFVEKYEWAFERAQGVQQMLARHEIKPILHISRTNGGSPRHTGRGPYKELMPWM
jgi:hypothetical protein